MEAQTEQKQEAPAPYQLVKHQFNGRRKWDIPRSCFILLALPREEHAKLKAWRQKNDSLIIDACHDGEVLILNTTKLDKVSARRQLKNKKPASD